MHHHRTRKDLRHSRHDYSQPGYYFVTVCVKDCNPWFGTIADTQMHLNEAGMDVQIAWGSLPYHYPGLQLDQYIVMPNHMHGILILENDFRHRNSRKGIKPTLSDAIRHFKGAATYRIHASGHHQFTWQISYYDIIIRNQRILDTIRQYIKNNPQTWTEDKLYIKESG